MKLLQLLVGEGTTPLISGLKVSHYPKVLRVKPLRAETNPWNEEWKTLPLLATITQESMQRAKRLISTVGRPLLVQGDRSISRVMC